MEFIYIYIYSYIIYITNCRQYCFSPLGLVRAVLISEMKVGHISHLECRMHASDRAQLLAAIYINIYLYIKSELVNTSFLGIKTNCSTEILVQTVYA